MCGLPWVLPCLRWSLWRGMDADRGDHDGGIVAPEIEKVPKLMLHTQEIALDLPPRDQLSFLRFAARVAG